MHQFIIQNFTYDKDTHTLSTTLTRLGVTYTEFNKDLGYQRISIIGKKQTLTFTYNRIEWDHMGGYYIIWYDVNFDDQHKGSNLHKLKLYIKV